MTVREKTENRLKELGIQFRSITHPPIFGSGDIERYVPMDEKTIVVKNLFLRDSEGKRLFLFVMRYFKKADLADLRAFLNSSRLGFNSKEKLMRYLGVEAGSVSPLSLMNDSEKAVKVVLDKGLTDYQVICMHPNDNRGSVYMEYASLLRFIESTGRDISFYEFNG